MADVFISYSRKDKQFVQKLDEALRQQKREAWVDWEGIQPTEEFMVAIYRAIESAHTFIFVLTPDSIASVVCGKEIAHAATQNKRMVPLVAREVIAADVPEALAKLNWIYFRDSDDFEKAAGTLITALDTDLDWVRAHTRLLTRAIEWEARGRNDSFVLRGVDLRAAEQWLAEAGAHKERQPTTLQTEYIIASRKAETQRQRTIRTWVTVAAVIAIVLAVIAVIQSGKAKKNEARAVTQEGIAKTNEARAVTEERKAKEENSHSEYLRALSLVQDGDADEALRVLAHSIELDPSNSLAATRLINLLGQRQWPHLATQAKHDLPVGMLKTNADASRIILATESAPRAAGSVWGREGESQFIYLLDAETLRGRKVELKCWGITNMRISGDKVLAVAREPQAMAFLLDAMTGEQLKPWESSKPSLGAYSYGCSLSDDGKSVVAWDYVDKGLTLEIVSAVDRKPRFPNLHISKNPVTVAMNGAELRILNEDGSVTIQPLKGGKAATTFPLVKDDPQLSFAQFGPHGGVLLGVRKNGVEFWPVSPPGKNDATAFGAGFIESKGLEMCAADSPGVESDITVLFQSEKQATIVAQNPQSQSAIARSWVTQIRSEDGHPSKVADWHSPFAPICLLSPGIVVAQDTKAFVLPFHGGFLSGPLRHEAQITAICGIREGVLATGSADGAVKLWNLPPALFKPVQVAAPLPKRPDDEEFPVLIARRRIDDVDFRVEIRGSDGIKGGHIGDQSRAPEGGSHVPQLYMIKGRAEAVKVQMPLDQMPRDTLDFQIGSVDLSADGELGIFSGEFVSEHHSSGGAWIFRIKDGKLLSGNVGQCKWAGLSPDQKQAFTILDDRLDFWNLGQDKKGLTTFKKAAQALAQTGMEGAVASDDGRVVATRSSTGEVITWDKAKGTPLMWLKRDPLWNDVDLDSGTPRDPELKFCKPALSAKGRLLAAAYGRAFAVWDLASGKPLSDPIFCDVEILSVDFSGSDPTTILATLKDGSIVSWDHADLGGALAPPDIDTLRQLALAVADDHWVDEAPKLAANSHPSSNVVAKLLEHFSSQARALQRNAQSPATALSK